MKRQGCQVSEAALTFELRSALKPIAEGFHTMECRATDEVVSLVGSGNTPLQPTGTESAPIKSFFFFFARKLSSYEILAHQA
jgi:hypothetical protein